jgi:hypothetical protein
MGCAHSAIGNDYHQAGSASQDMFSPNNNSSSNRNQPNLFLDTDAVERGDDDDEVTSPDCSTPTRETEHVAPKMQIPPTPQYPEFVFEGRSFLQSPINKSTRARLLDNFTNSSPKRFSRREMKIPFVLQE